MARFFIGSALHKLDAKGRVSLPSDFRDVLRAHGNPESFVLVPAEAPGRPHEAYTLAGHEALVERLGKLAYASPAQRDQTRRRYIWNAKSLALEETGRFVLSRELRSAIGLDGLVRFVGDGPTFKLWEPSAYDAQVAAEGHAAEALEIDPAALL
ncbi:MAG: division/cell wall cluster transcriptional repressor MraZ [Paracoccaceae bacterium]